MKYFNKYKFIIGLLIFLLITTLVLTVFNLLFAFSNSINNILCLTSLSLYALFLGIRRGKNINEKAYLDGFKTGGIIILLLYIMNGFFISFKIGMKSVFYYLLILVFVVLGEIMGINKKKKN